MAEMYATSQSTKNGSLKLASRNAPARPSGTLRSLKERLVEKGRILATTTARMYLPQWGYLRAERAHATMAAPRTAPRRASRSSREA